MKMEADSQYLLSFQSGRSSVVEHVGEMSLGSPRKSQDVQGVMGEFAGKGNERKEEKMRGGWNQKGKRRRWKPKWCRAGWKASTWTLMVKVAMKGIKSKNPEGKAKRQEKKVKKLRGQKGK